MEKAIRSIGPSFCCPRSLRSSSASSWPFIWGIYLSFCDSPRLRKTQFVGIQNYIQRFQDTTFLHAFGFTRPASPSCRTVLINVMRLCHCAGAHPRHARDQPLPHRVLHAQPHRRHRAGLHLADPLNGVLAQYSQAIWPLDEGRLRRAGHPDVLAADRLHDDHLRRRPAERSRRPDRGRRDRRCQPVEPA